jgi:hypothetical protein
MAAAGCYLLYKLWAPERGSNDGPSIEIGERGTASSAPHVKESALFNDSVPATIRVELPVAPIYPVEHLPREVNYGVTAPLENPDAYESVTPAFTTDIAGGDPDEHDFSLDGLFQEREVEAAAAVLENVSQSASLAPEGTNDVPKDKKRDKPKKKRGLKNKVAQFPFDVRAWEDPGTPRSVARAQSRAERAEKLQQLDETRAAVSDAVSKGGGSLVLANPIEEQREMFADVWQLASGEAPPEAVADGNDKATRRSVERSAKRAEREERKLEKLRAKEDKKRSRETSEATKESYIETEDPWAPGVGHEAFIDAPSEVGAPEVWVETEQPELPVTWEIDGVGAGMGEKATTWEAAAAAVGPLVPSATMISGDELLELGASIVIGTEPGAGDGAFYLPDGFDTVEETEPKRRRIGRKKREAEDLGEIESVTDWAQGGVVLDPDEGVNYQEYDIPEPIPSRTIVLFGENEES